VIEERTATRVPTGSRPLGLGAVAAGLIVVGLGLIVVPPLLRDGVCGLLSCADQVPDIAVARTSPQELAVLVPGPAAPDVSAVRLLEGSTSGAESWLIVRDDDGEGGGGRSDAGEAPDAFVIGRTPPGFRSVTGDGVVPGAGNWIAEVRFRCTVASVRFEPAAMAVGQVRSWSRVTDGTSFTSSAQTDERCATEAGGLERVLMWIGIVAAAVGALMGTTAVLRRSADLEGEEAAWRGAGWDGDDDADPGTGP
jgi:hypothetical protein